MTEHPFPKTLPEGALRAVEADLPDIPFDPVARRRNAPSPPSFSQPKERGDG